MLMNESQYEWHRRRVEQSVDRVLAAIDGPRPASVDQTLFHYIDMNLAHLGGLTSVEERTRVAREAMANLLLIRDVDHAPEYISSFCPHVELNDPWGCVGSDAPTIYAGFHTGPYWAIVSQLIKANKDLSIIFPSSLAAIEKSIYQSFLSMKEGHGSCSTLEFLRVDNASFFLRARSAVRAGRSLLLYMDANSSGLGGGKGVLDARVATGQVMVSTSILTLAGLVNAQVATFNAMRLDGMARTLTIGRPHLISKNPEDLARVAQSLFDDLSHTLVRNMAHWEGWLYAHRLMRPGTQRLLEGTSDWKSRYFVEEIDGQQFVLDKAEMKAYGIRT